ncbi:MAG: hypothetical protein ACKVS8_10135 [Phycisphaerales bacterium]
MIDYAHARDLTPTPATCGRLSDLLHIVRARAGLDGTQVSAPAGTGPLPLVDAEEAAVIAWLEDCLSEVGEPRRVAVSAVNNDHVCVAISGVRGASSRVFPLAGAGQPFGEGATPGTARDAA